MCEIGNGERENGVVTPPSWIGGTGDRPPVGCRAKFDSYKSISMILHIGIYN